MRDSGVTTTDKTQVTRPSAGTQNSIFCCASKKCQKGFSQNIFENFRYLNIFIYAFVHHK